MSDEQGDRPDFGPGGYLPDRASRRARKIVLRAPMGIQWVLGSLAVGIVVVVAGWLALRDQGPPPSYVEVPDGAPISVLNVSGADPMLVVRDVGRPRVFTWAGGATPQLCAASGLLEAPDGRTWRVTGRGLGGTESLGQHPLVVTDGTVYVDPTTTDPVPPADPTPPERGCD